MSKVSLITGLVDMFVTWTALAYFGGVTVFSTTPIGIWNSILVPIMGLMTIHSVVGLFVMAKNPNGSQEYLRELDQENDNSA